MITFLLSWCAVSVVATLIALAMIRAGKRRQPHADDFDMQVNYPFAASNVPRKPDAGPATSPALLTRHALEAPLS